MKAKNVVFTKAQQSAIDAENVSLSVSAAAGSGKTAVLTERIIRKVIDKGADVGRFLVVTFTKAAASELKDRLASKLEASAAEHPENTHLMRQLSRIKDADISTVHSFCFNVIRQCFYNLGLPAKLRIAADTERELLLGEALGEVVERHYSGTYARHASFEKLSAACTNGKNDAGLGSMILSVYNEILSYPLPVKLLALHAERAERELETISSGRKSVFDSAVFAEYFAMLSENVSEAFRAVSRAADICREDETLSDKYLPVINAEISFFRYCAELFSGKCSEELIEKIEHASDGYTKSRLPQIRSCDCPDKKVLVQELRNDAHKALKRSLDGLLIRNEDQLFRELSVSCELQTELCAVISDLTDVFSSKKLERGLLDYSDLEHYAFAALVDPDSYDHISGSFEKTELAEKLAGSIDEVYVDEYQDTNLLQDAIFRAVSRGDNLFTVGDVKQSIYGFRGAVPEVFSRRVSLFEENDPKGKAVFLSENFRSDRSVISVVNRVFEKVMNGGSGIAYSEKERLVFSKDGDSGYPCELYFIDKSVSDAGADGEDAGNTEALFIADKVKKILSEGMKNEKGEPIGPGDIAVLVRGNAQIPVVRRALDGAGVPSFSFDGDPFSDAPEALSLISLIGAADNPVRDVPFIGAMTCPIFGFSPDDLMTVREYVKDGCFYEAAVKYAAENTGRLAEELSAFLAKLAGYRRFSMSNTVFDTVRYIIEDTEILSVYPSEDEKKRVSRRENVLRILSAAEDFDGFSSGGLSGFGDYLMKASEHDAPSGASPEGRVRVMTIHKSKGLEFPVCFVSFTGQGFSFMRNAPSVILDSKSGVSFSVPSEDGSLRVSSLQRLIAIEKYKKACLEEEKRVLYVALTRARQRLIITGQKSVPSSGLRADGSHISSLLDMILYGLSDDPAFLSASEEYFSGGKRSARALSADLSVTFISDADAAKLVSEDRTESTKESEKPEDVPEITEPEEDRTGLFEKILSFRYPEPDTLPAKASVSELYRGYSFGEDDGDEKENGESSEKAVSPLDAAAAVSALKKSASFVGTSMHRFMQFCDFDFCVRHGTVEEAKRLVSAEFISREAAGVLSHKKLAGFFASPLFDRISRSGNVMREMRFNVNMPSAMFPGFAGAGDEKTILVQGVIDCFFEDKDGNIVLLDYKTDHVLPGEEKILTDRYGAQLLIYAAAIEMMTGKKVKEIYIYSFALGKALRI